MKKQKGFSNIEEREKGDIIWNGSAVEKIGGIKPKFIDKIFNISDDLQNVFTNTCNIPVEKLNDIGRKT